MAGNIAGNTAGGRTARGGGRARPPPAALPPADTAAPFAFTALGVPVPLLHPALVADPARPAEHLLPAPFQAAPFQAASFPAAPFLPAACLSDEPGTVDLATLRDLTAAFAGVPAIWRPVIQHRPDRRWYTRLLLSATVEVWLIGWYPGQQTEVHDHGGALGAMTVAEGRVEEDRYDRNWTITRVREHRTGASVGFGAKHVHRVANRGQEIATTIHAYSPPELPMRFAPTQDGADARAAAVPEPAALKPAALAPAVPAPAVPAPAGRDVATLGAAR
ncbi:cysteine dioxygenase family protein [Frankia sp. AiPs1]|nr:cysteine dioxygenase family protein [Frankia sp. AiPs1]